MEDHEEPEKSVSIAEIEDGEYFVIEIENINSAFAFMIDRASAMWLATEIFQRTCAD